MSADGRPDLPLKSRLRQTLYLTLSRFTRGMTLGVRGVVFRGDEVLLVRHSYVPGWYFPGGGVDPGESFADAVRRELAEEARVVLAGPPKLFGVYLNRTASPRDHVAVFLCPDWREDPALPGRPREIPEYGFFPLSRLPDGTTAGTLRRLREIAGDAVTPDW